MHASTPTLGLNPAADPCLARVRTKRIAHWGAPRTMTRSEPRLDTRWPADERRSRRAHANRMGGGLAATIENVLFAVTLAAIGYVYLGALPALAL